MHQKYSDETNSKEQNSGFEDTRGNGKSQDVLKYGCFY